MSGSVGVLHRDGRPATAAALEPMLAAAPHRGPDGTSVRVDGPIAMAHHRMATTIEAAHEGQPIADRSGRLLAFDGRIDEYDGARVGTGWPTSDAALVLSAWNAWGEGCLSRLAGDFAFALWDPRDRSLFCARDPLGVQPFYYAERPDLFVWGTELGQVLAHPAVDRTPDEGYAAELLTVYVRSEQATLYRGVRRLPPGHALVVDASGLRVFRYWDIELAREIRYRRDEEYADHFRALFEEAVKCRLRSSRPVASHLSGGLDSSSIVVVAADLARRGMVPLIQAVSLAFPRRAEIDETSYIKDVVGAAGVPWIRVEAPPFDAAGWRRSVVRRRDFPEFPNDAAFEGIRRALTERGVLVTLSGEGGDHALTGSFFHYADLLRRGRFVAAFRRYADVARTEGMSWTSAMFLRGGVWPVLPPAARRAARRIVRRWRSHGVPGWIAAPFARRTALADRLRHDPVPDRLPSVARYDTLQQYRSGLGTLINEAGERASAEAGLEDRHPFLDRRLVEFMTALPDEQRWHRGQTKYILRRAMTGLLPESVLRRRDKADFSGLFLDAIDALGGSAFYNDLELARLGWIDADEVTALYHRMRTRRSQGGLAYSEDAWSLWAIAGVETWVRSVTEGCDGATGEAARGRRAGSDSSRGSAPLLHA
jgi:asparagine synthase (glutamine-hydrolysing)